jgi:hypothetical protein
MWFGMGIKFHGVFFVDPKKMFNFAPLNKTAAIWNLTKL